VKRPARLDRLPEQYFMRLLAHVQEAAARDGEPLVDFGRGNPDIPPPTHVVEALIGHALKHVTEVIRHALQQPATDGVIILPRFFWTTRSAARSWVVTRPPRVARDHVCAV